MKKEKLLETIYKILDKNEFVKLGDLLLDNESILLDCGKGNRYKLELKALKGAKK